MSDVRFNTLIRTWATTLLCAAAALAAPARVAVLFEPAGQRVPPAVSLAEATLGGDVAVVERLAIDRVLAEQRDATALGTGDGSVRLGRLLSADVLAVAQCDDATAAPTGLVVFDAATGARLWDAALPADPATAADAMAVAIRASVAKRALPPDRRRTACLFSVRNADLPRDRDAFCDAVGRLVERRLTASPDVAVLERARLDRVTAERALPTADPADNRLLASVVLVQLDITRGEKPGEVRAAAVLTDVAGRSLGTEAVAGSDDGEALATALANAICRHVRATVPAGATDRPAEGRRFAAEAQFAWDHLDRAAALRSAESARALDPDDAHLQAALAHALLGRAIDVISPRYPDGATDVSAGPEETRSTSPQAWAESFALFGSGLSELEAATRHLARGGASPLFDPQVGIADKLAHLYLCVLWEDQRGWPRRWHLQVALSAEQRAAFVELQDAYRRYWLDVLEPAAVAGAIATPGVAAYNAYALQLNRELDEPVFVLHGDDDAGRWSDDLLAALHRWTEVAARCKPRSPHDAVRDFDLVASIDLWFTQPTMRVGPHTWAHRPWTSADLDGWDAVFAAMVRLPSDSYPFRECSAHGVRWVAAARAALAAGAPMGQFKSSNALFGRAPPPPVAPSTRPIPGWAASRPLVDLLGGTDPAREVCAPVVDGEVAYAAVRFQSPGGPIRLRLTRFPLADAGAPPVVLAEVKDSDAVRVVNPDGVWYATYQPVPAFVADGFYWVACATRLYGVPVKGGPTRQVEATDMPARPFQAAASLGVHLFAAVGPRAKDGYLVEVDPATGQVVRTVASSRRAEQLSPFDAGPPFQVPAMKADAPRHRIVLYAESPLWEPGRSGLWEYRPDTGRFRQLHAATPVPVRPNVNTPMTRVGDWFTPATVSPTIDGRFVVQERIAAYTYDLNTDRVTPLRMPVGGQDLAHLAGPQPFVPWGDMLCGSMGRYRPGSEPRYQRNPPVRAGVRPENAEPRFVLPVDRHRAVIGDPFGMWLVTAPGP